MYGRTSRVIVVTPIIDYSSKAPDFRGIQIDVELSISVIVYQKYRSFKGILEIAEGFELLFYRLIIQTV